MINCFKVMNGLDGSIKMIEHEPKKERSFE